MSGATDLRAFLDFVREHLPREYLVVHREVEPAFEMAAIVARLEQGMRAPILEFRNVRGSRFPVVTNVCASLPRIARSLGITPAQLETRLIEAYARPRIPRAWPDGRTAPVRDVVHGDDEVDLRDLPQIRYTEAETAPYITAAALVARNPETSTLNVSYHRLMVLDARHTACFAVPGGHLDRILAANASRGEDTPVAAFIGAHPLWSLGSLAGGAADLDELALTAGLTDDELQVTPSLVDSRLRIPAHAEIAIEGVIRRDRQVEEGPFGEFAGYAASRGAAPVLEVRYLSHRRDAIYQDIVAGRLEHLTMSGAALRARLERNYVRALRGVLEIHLPAPMTLFVKVDKAQLGGTTPGELIERLLREEQYLKQVMCFDPDIELKSQTSVQWAISTRVQPDRDLYVYPDQRGTLLDPSEIAGRTAKWGMDATAKPDLDRFAPRNRIPEGVLGRIDLKALLAGGGAD